MSYKDPTGPLRKAYFSLLSGQLTYGGNPIPIYDEFAHDDAPDLFVVLGAQYDDDQSNYAKWNSGCVVVVDIVMRSKRAVTKDVVDDISNQIKALLLPTRTTHGLVIDSPFVVTNLFRESSTYQSFMNNVNKIIRKIERYRQDVLQDEIV